jgi:hypothetical protein
MPRNDGEAKLSKVTGEPRHWIEYGVLAFVLPHDAEPGLSDRVGKGILVNLSSEPTTEHIGNFEGTADDPFAHRLPQPRIPLLHPSASRSSA